MRSPCGHLLARLGQACPRCGNVWQASEPMQEVAHGGQDLDLLPASAEPGVVHVEREEREPEYHPEEGVEIAGRRFSYDIDALRAERCRRSFAHYCRDAWPRLQHLAETKLEWSWVQDAVCQHLQVMAEDWAEARKTPARADAIQRIRNLLINLPPGNTKTLITLVFFPTWMWTRWPRWSVRCVSSNGRSISESSNYSRQLVKSEWYRDSFIPKTAAEHWAKHYKLVPWRIREEQDAESDWGNSMGGYRRSTGFKAPITGEHSDWILCVKKGTMVSTEIGEIPIEDLGAMRTRPRVWAMDTKTGEVVLRRITGWAHTGRKKTVSIRLDSGQVLTCTDDHPVWTGTEYTEAGRLAGRQVSVLRGTQEPVQGVQRDCVDLRDVPETVQARGGGTRQAPAPGDEVWTILQQGLPECVADGAADHQGVRLVPPAVPAPQQEGLASVLFAGVLGRAAEGVQGAEDARGPRLRPLPFRDEIGLDATALLLTALQECGALQAHAGDWKLELLGAPGQVLRRRSLGEPGAADPPAGRSSVCCVPGDCGSPGVGRPPRGPRPNEQPAGESDHALRFVPQHAPQVQRATVLSVEPSLVGGRHEEVDVYDISVEGCRNFFADGVLVHNCDDPHDAEEVNSEPERRRVLSRWDNAIYNRVNDGRIACRVIVMQRLHVDDLAAHVKDAPSWACLLIAQEYEPQHALTTPIGWKDPRVEPGELLDPVRFPPSWIAIEKGPLRLGMRGYNAQHQQRPESAEGGLFKVGYWNFFRRTDQVAGWTRPRDYTERPSVSLGLTTHDELDVDWVCVTMDATGGAVNAAASEVGLLIVAGKAERRYVLDDCTPGPRTFLQQLDDLKVAVRRAHKLTLKRQIRVLVEKKALGEACIEQVQKAMGDGDFRTEDGRQVMVVVEPYEPGKGSKEGRCLAMEPDLAAGVAYLPEGAPWLEKFIRQLASFPSGAKNDRVDALAQVLDRYRHKITWAEALKRAGR